jgi:hypothetical protein
VQLEEYAPEWKGVIGRVRFAIDDAEGVLDGVQPFTFRKLAMVRSFRRLRVLRAVEPENPLRPLEEVLA